MTKISHEIILFSPVPMLLSGPTYGWPYETNKNIAEPFRDIQI